MADINVGQIAEALNEKMDRNLSNTDAIGQAILDGKVEVEALLEQNGYAKFTWKNGNKLSKLIVQWLRHTENNTDLYLPLPTTFSSTWVFTRQINEYSSSSATIAPRRILAFADGLSQIHVCQPDTSENLYFCIGY